MKTLKEYSDILSVTVLAIHHIVSTIPCGILFSINLSFSGYETSQIDRYNCHTRSVLQSEIDNYNDFSIQL